MIDKNDKPSGYRQEILALLLMTGILSSVALLQPVVKSNIVSKQPAQNTSSPIIAKVDNPFFNPVFFLSKPETEEFNKAMDNAAKELDASQPTFKDAKKEFTKMLPAALDKLNK